MRPVFTERQLGMAGSLADLGFFRVFGNPSERSERVEHWGGLGLRENEISAFVS